VIVPSNLANEPRTLLTIKWRTEKPTFEWIGSMAHVPETKPGTLTAVVLMGASW
jgi:hypothetical protein